MKKKQKTNKIWLVLTSEGRDAVLKGKRIEPNTHINKLGILAKKPFQSEQSEISFAGIIKDRMANDVYYCGRESKCRCGEW